MTPEYILANWTEEEFNLMLEKLIKRKERESEAIQGHYSAKQTISEDQFFKQAGIKVMKR